jgi:hypothetical protein
MQKRVTDVMKQVRAEFGVFENDLEQCPTWHSRFASDANHELVRSDVPALVLTAEFDDRTPTEHGKRIASALKNSYHFELPGVIHGSGIVDGCGESIVLQFLQNPNRKPDVSCIASMPRVKFELKTLESPSLFFDIASADGKVTAFTGSWGAMYPAIDSVVRFALRAGWRKTHRVVRRPRRPVIRDIRGHDRQRHDIVQDQEPDGERTISLVGKLSRDEISFRREIEVRPGGRPGGAFLWGSGGPKSFSASRVP